MAASLPETTYRLAVRGVRALDPLLGHGDSKLARGVRGRRGVVERLTAWGRERRDPSRPLVWLHAPSVGEGLQARAVVDALLDRRDDVQTVFTHFSPSAEELARAMPVDTADYLPWDVRSDVSPVLDALRPSLLVFTKTEVWPILVDEAGRRGAGSVLVAATLPPTSSRLRWPARSVLRPTVGRLTEVMAVGTGDAERFVRLGAPEDRVTVTGDPGIDSAARRAANADPDAPALAPFTKPSDAGRSGVGESGVGESGSGGSDAGGPRPVFVAGSTWPADERVLLEALDRLRAEYPGLLFVVAPHEPDEAHLAPLETELERRGWRSRRLAEVEAAGEVGDADAVVVDRVGVLAHLYTVGDVAYVGGGFHDQGLHSVLEPAAAAVPVAFGPRHHNAPAAAELVECGGGRAAPDAGALAGVLGTWLGIETERTGSGRAARAYIEGHLGAAGRTADRLVALLG